MVRKKARLNQSNNPLSPTEKVLAQFEQVSQSTSQQVIAKRENGSKSEIILRKATFKIDEQILEQLDHYHLKLQLQLGKRNTPHKETMVELALKTLLSEVESDPEKLLQRLQKQQQLREN
jgi:hypothetical protein